VALLGADTTIGLRIIGHRGKVGEARSTDIMFLLAFRIDGSHLVMLGLRNKVTVSRGAGTSNSRDMVTASRKALMGAAPSNVHRHRLGVDSSIRSRATTDRLPLEMDDVTRVLGIDSSIRTSHPPGSIKVG
jgi:hypothetical protein